MMKISGSLIKRMKNKGYDKGEAAVLLLSFKSVLLPISNIYYSFELIINISKEAVDMSANVETMFYTRVTPWHGLGTRVEEAPNSREALILAGLDWQVIQKPVMTGDGEPVSGFKANIRDRDGRVLGVVTDR